MKRPAELDDLERQANRVLACDRYAVLRRQWYRLHDERVAAEERAVAATQRFDAHRQRRVHVGLDRVADQIVEYLLDFPSVD